MAFNDGGAEEDRTPDLRIANATLSQLSYGPKKSRALQAPEPASLQEHADSIMRKA